MTRPRYEAYLRIRGELELMTPATLAESEKELLRDAAEGLLLARDHELDEVEELRARAAMALSLLVDDGRWSEAAADEVWERLVACGPRKPAPALTHVV